MALACWFQRVTNLGKSNLMRMGCEVSPEVETRTLVFCRHCEVKGRDGVGEDFDGLEIVWEEMRCWLLINLHLIFFFNFHIGPVKDL